MITLVYEKQSEVPCSAEQLFRWHEDPEAFRRLLPPGEPVTVLHHDGHIRNGARAVLRVGHRPFCFRWELEHQGYEPGRQFCDVQLSGPFTAYRHEHRMIPVAPDRCLLHDRITFALPGGRVGAWIGRKVMMRKFERLFCFRHEVTRRAFA